MTITCPKCRAAIGIPANFAAGQFQCPSCGQWIEVVRQTPAQPHGTPQRRTVSPYAAAAAMERSRRRRSVLTGVIYAVVIGGVIAGVVAIPIVRFNNALKEARTAEAAGQWVVALAAYERAAELRNNNADVEAAIKRVSFSLSMERARNAESKSQWETALREYDNARGFKPDDQAAKAGINRARYNIDMESGRDAEKTEKWQAALWIYKHAETILPEEQAAKAAIKRVQHQIAMQSGATAEKERDWGAAAQAYAEALSLSPGNEKAVAAAKRVAASELQEQYDTIMNIAAQSEEARQLPVAREAYQQALQLKPSDLTATAAIQRIDYTIAMERATAAAQVKDWASVLTACDEALKLRPGDPAAVAARKQAVETQQKEQQQALAEAQIQERYDVAMMRAGQAEQRKDWIGATMGCYEALRVKPNDPAAIAFLKRISDSQKSDQLDVTFQKARQAEAAKQWAIARQLYMMILRDNPGNPTATTALAELEYQEAMERGAMAEARLDWNSAEKAFRRALSIKPNDNSAQDALVRINDKAKAEEERMKQQHQPQPGQGPMPWPVPVPLGR